MNSKLKVLTKQILYSAALFFYMFRALPALSLEGVKTWAGKKLGRREKVFPSDKVSVRETCPGRDPRYRGARGRPGTMANNESLFPILFNNSS